MLHVDAGLRERRVERATEGVEIDQRPWRLPELRARHRAWARRRGLVQVASGAVTHVQRFGSSINLNVHFHVMVLDGFFVRDEQGRLSFHPAPPPTRQDLDQVVRQAHRRTMAWLARKRYVGVALEGRSQEPAPQTSLDACAAIATQRGAVRALRDAPQAEQERTEGMAAPPVDQSAVEHEGFNLHAGVVIAADDDLGRERLMRYGARPPLALDRLRRLPGGCIGYRIKKLRNGRAKHRVMTPLEFLARLAAIVPPPRYPLLRYHGVLGPRSAWRRDIVPRPRNDGRSSASSPSLCAETTSRSAPRPSAVPSSVPRPSSRVDRSAISVSAGATSASPEAAGPLPISLTPGAELLTPNVLSVKHWNRLFGGLLYAASPRIDWASLLRRSFDVDVLACPKCSGRLRVLGEVTEPAMVKLVLECVGLPTEAPRAARARDPTELLAFLDLD